MKSINKQQGATLVSMMIGVVISMIIMIATFTFFMKVNQYSTDVKKDSQIEGDISMLFLIMQNEFQNSGFSLPGNDHIYFEKIADLYKVHWRYKLLDESDIICRSMEEILVENDDGKSSIEIQFFTPSNTCNDADNLKSMRWDVYDYTALKFENRSKGVISNISLNDEKCAPYMIGDTENSHQILEVEINGTVETLVHKLSLCLVNI